MKSCLIKNCRKCRRRLALCKCVEPVTEPPPKKGRAKQVHLFRREALDEDTIDFLFWCWWKWLKLDPSKYPDKYPLWYREQQEEYEGEW